MFINCNRNNVFERYKIYKKYKKLHPLTIKKLLNLETGCYVDELPLEKQRRLQMLCEIILDVKNNGYWIDSTKLEYMIQLLPFTDFCLDISREIYSFMLDYCHAGFPYLIERLCAASRLLVYWEYPALHPPRSYGIANWSICSTSRRICYDWFSLLSCRNTSIGWITLIHQIKKDILKDETRLIIIWHNLNVKVENRLYELSGYYDVREDPIHHDYFIDDNGA